MTNHPSLLFRIGKKLITMTSPFLSDEAYLKLLFRYRCGYKLNLASPQTFNEKLQWLKLHDRHQEYEKLVDKIDAKNYVAGIVGSQYIIPTIATWNTIDDIDWSILPNQFVIKCTSDSGGVVVCKDKSKLDIKKAIKKLRKGWGRNYYNQNKEYPYRNLKPRIIAEQYLEDESGYELKDYKIFCFDGEPKFLFVATGRQQHDTRFDFFDLEWNPLPFLNTHPNSGKNLQKPDNFDEMLRVARKLSQGIPHVRVDLYNVKGKIYFGELTFFHNSGMVKFEPMEWDYKFGDYIKLPINK
ncbi:ATP-grasp fold amidoligase family protein [Marseilla massiliensis]|uniref:ATP-grasp fold amidoligase family protein n=1 Tax=Marseilla massiliensis TaxID=1841864 RepID=UPI0030C8D199